MNAPKNKPNARLRTRKGLAACLAWFLLFLGMAYGYWLAMTNAGISDFWDPVYEHKYELLQARIAEHPGRPLWLILGSSHVDNGVGFKFATDRVADEKAPMIFNFGMAGSDTFRQLIALRRLLKSGVRPRCVGIEVNVTMSATQSQFVEDPTVIARARRDELAEFESYTERPALFRGIWMESRWNPFFASGMLAPGQALILRLLPIPWLRRFEAKTSDPWGWGSLAIKQPPKAIYDGVVKKAGAIAASYSNFHIGPGPDRALRAMLDLCKSAGIQPVLIRMPEAPEILGFYPPQAVNGMRDYLEKITQEYGAPVLDARDWVVSEGFTDAKHLNITGADIFTRRFVREFPGPSRPPVAPPAHP